MTSLIEKGWDPQLKDLEGRRPADYSQRCRGEHSGCQEVIAILGKPSQVLSIRPYKILQGLKSMVPNKVSPNAMFYIQPGRFTLGGYRPILSIAIQYLGRCVPECTPQDLAGIKYLIDEGANPNGTTSDMVRSK